MDKIYIKRVKEFSAKQLRRDNIYEVGSFLGTHDFESCKDSWYSFGIKFNFKKGEFLKVTFNDYVVENEDGTYTVLSEYDFNEAYKEVE